MSHELIDVLAIALAFVALIAILVACRPEPFSTESYEVVSYTVKSGDSLWALGCVHCAEADDIRDWISAVEELNNCNAELKVGQKLKLYTAQD